MNEIKKITSTPKPCPFCGCKTTILSDGCLSNYIFVKCVECEAKGPEIKLKSYYEITDQDELNAITEWNNRLESSTKLLWMAIERIIEKDTPGSSGDSGFVWGMNTCIEVIKDLISKLDDSK